MRAQLRCALVLSLTVLHGCTSAPVDLTELPPRFFVDQRLMYSEQALPVDHDGSPAKAQVSDFIQANMRFPVLVRRADKKPSLPESVRLRHVGYDPEFPRHTLFQSRTFCSLRGGVEVFFNGRAAVTGKTEDIAELQMSGGSGCLVLPRPIVNMHELFNVKERYGEGEAIVLFPARVCAPDVFLISHLAEGSGSLSLAGLLELSAERSVSYKRILSRCPVMFAFDDQELPDVPKFPGQISAMFVVEEKPKKTTPPTDPVDPGEAFIVRDGTTYRFTAEYRAHLTASRATVRCTPPPEPNSGSGNEVQTSPLSGHPFLGR